MGFGGGSSGPSAGQFAQQDTQLMQMFASQVGALGQQQQAYGATVASQDAAALQAMNMSTQSILGQTKQQQQKAVDLGVMDFIKTGPQGLANMPASTGKLGLI